MQIPFLYGSPIFSMPLFSVKAAAFRGDKGRTRDLGAHARRTKYSGADLREIRSTGQARECARRRRQLCQH